MSSTSTRSPNQYESVWQEFIPDFAWGTLLLGVLVAVGFYLTISAALAGALPYALATLLCSYLTFASFTVMHDAGHGGIVRAGSRYKPLEHMLGWVASLPLLIAPYRLFQKIHDRHHAFTNDPDRDPDHYTFSHSWTGVVLNCLLIPFQYHFLALTKLRHIQVIRDTYPGTVLYLLFTAGSLATLTYQGFGLEVLCFALLPNGIAIFFLTMFFDYIPHHPHQARDRYHDTRIYPGKLLNVLLLGQNYHLIHHMYPRLPWYSYQNVYRRILPDLKANHAPIGGMTEGLKPGAKTPATGDVLLDDGQKINMVLEVANVSQLTPDAVTVNFALPQNQSLKYLAGQYITLSKWLEGEYHTRCYSLCSAPGDDTLQIGVRHTPNGVMSGYINQHLKVGDPCVVQGPFGDFVFPPKGDKDIKHLTLIAGGSGITPILAIIETALRQQAITIDLIYACRTREGIMFFDRLQHWQQRYPKQFKARYVITEDTAAPPDVCGRLDSAMLERLLPDLKDDASDLTATAFYICGPEGLKDKVVHTLESHRVAPTQIHVEQFVPLTTAPEGRLHNVDITLDDGTTHSLKVASNQTILEIAKASAVHLPHACGAGTCGSCKLRVVSGEAQPVSDGVAGITIQEKHAGMTLACQCKPREDMVVSTP